MKNSDMPAMPAPKKLKNPDDSMRYLGDGAYQTQGLTKREYYAGLAIQGLASTHDEDGAWTHDPEVAAEAAVAYADALLKELEKDE